MTIVTLQEDGDDLVLPIPDDILSSLDLHEGDTLLFEIKNDTVYLTKKEYDNEHD